MAKHLAFGKHGEAIAKAYLESTGYVVLEVNWTYGKLELDIVAYKGQQLIFVEVKTRNSFAFGWPEEFVDELKKKNIAKAAEAYIFLRVFKGEVRFDIISVLFHANGCHEITHIKDAFWPGQ